MASASAALRASPITTPVTHKTASRRCSTRRAAVVSATAAAPATMSAPMKVSDAAKLGPSSPSFALPAHPSYSMADAIKLALEEDVADIGDISSLSTCVTPPTHPPAAFQPRPALRPTNTNRGPTRKARLPLARGRWRCALRLDHTRTP